MYFCGSILQIIGFLLAGFVVGGLLGYKKTLGIKNRLDEAKRYIAAHVKWLAGPDIITLSTLMIGNVLILIGLVLNTIASL